MIEKSVDSSWNQEKLLCYLIRVHLVFHPHGIAPTSLKFDSWSQGAGFIPILSTKGINQI